MRMKRITKLMYLLSVLFIVSCSTEDDCRLTFVGDSIVARWDLEEYFPTYMTENDGISGAGIGKIKELAHMYLGKDIVVLIGTNDVAGISDETLDVYSKDYITSIVELDAKKIYLFSILPRDFKSDIDGINERISKLNALIAERAGNYAAITYINMFEEFYKDGTLNIELSYDGLHLSPYGYEKLSNSLKKYLK